MAKDQQAADDSAVSADRAAPESAFEAAIRRGVERWIDEHLRNTEFSRDTGAWNVLQKALPSLTPTIVEEIQ